MIFSFASFIDYIKKFRVSLYKFIGVFLYKKVTPLLDSIENVFPMVLLKELIQESRRFLSQVMDTLILIDCEIELCIH